MLRDSLLIGLFDGSSIVNLYSLTTQFKALSRRWLEVNGSASGHQRPVREWAKPLPEFAWNNLSLTRNGHNCFLEALPSSLEAARSLGGPYSPSADVSSALHHQTNLLETAANTLMKKIGSVNFASPHVVSSQAFDWAREYCALEAAAMTLEMWLAQGECSNQAHWLVLALARLNVSLGQKTNLSDDFFEPLVDQLAQGCTQMRYEPAEDLLSAA